MKRMEIRFVGLCLSCRAVTVLYEDCADPGDPRSMDLMDDRIPDLEARCGKCAQPCCAVSLEVNGDRVEPWMAPEAYEARSG